MIEIKPGTELVDSDGDRAVVFDVGSSPSVLTSDGYVLKYVNIDTVCKNYTPTDYMYTEVLALLSHMKVMERLNNPKKCFDCIYCVKSSETDNIGKCDKYGGLRLSEDTCCKHAEIITDEQS